MKKKLYGKAKKKKAMKKEEKENKLHYTLGLVSKELES